MKVHHRYGLATRLYLKLLPPFMLISALGGVNSFVDSVLAGRLLGVTGMAAIGLYFPFACIVLAIGSMFMSGAQILCGKLLGKNDIDGTNGVFTLDIIMSLAVSSVFMVLTLAVPSVVAGVLGATGEIADELVSYLRGMAFSYIPQMLCMQIATFLQVENARKRTYAGTAVVTIVNAVLDVVFMKVLGMGLYGLGLSTSVANIAYLLVLLPHYLHKGHSIRIDLKKVRFRDARKVIGLGSPGATLYACLFFRDVFLNHLLIDYCGGTTVAAYSAFSNFAFICFAVANATAPDVSMLISTYSGERDRTSMVEVMRAAFTNGLAASMVIFVIQAFAAKGMALLFFGSTDTEVVSQTALAYRVLGVNMLLCTIINALSSCYQALGKVWMALTTTILEAFVLVVAAAMILVPAFGPLGCWIAFIVSSILTLLFVAVCAAVKNRRIPVRISDIMMLSDDVGLPDSMRLDMTVDSMEMVAGMSEMIMTFCRERDVDGRRAYHMSLCMEEMAGNIIRHGFNDGKDHMIDVRVAVLPDSLILRLSDDCKPFNPREFMAMTTAKNSDMTGNFRNIGIRLVFAVARDITYNRIMGINILTIEQ